MRPIDVLKRYFGYSAFRLEQEAVIDHILSGRDALVLMLIGGGAKDDTKEISLRMYKGGKSVDEIGRERGLTPDTIMGHLSFYILQGSVTAEYLVSAEKIPEISRAVRMHGADSLGVLKRELGEGQERSHPHPRPPSLSVEGGDAGEVWNGVYHIR